MIVEEKCRVRLKSIAYYSQFGCVNRIHIVDLMGAKAQHAREFDYIKSLGRLTTKDIGSRWWHSHEVTNHGLLCRRN